MRSLFALLLSGLCIGVACGQTTPLQEVPPLTEAFLAEAARNYFKTLDADGDGRVSRDEYIAPLMRQFRSADSNGDGYLSPEELAASVRGAMLSGAPRSARRAEAQ